MCGIIGAYKKISKVDLINFFELLSHRGEHSYGLIDLVNSKAYKALELTPTLKPIYKKGLSEELPKELSCFIAHNRAASIGGVSLELAHPIQHKDFLVIHNGTKKSLYTVTAGAKSDTHAIALLAPYLFKNIELADILLEDVGVVFIYNTTTKQILLIKTSARPLMLNKEKGVFASEPLFVGKWAAIKEGVYVLNSLKEIASLPLHKEVEVEDFALTYPTICRICDKMHYTNSQNVCFSCSSQGKKPLSPYYGDEFDYWGTYYHTPSKKAKKSSKSKKSSKKATKKAQKYPCKDAFVEGEIVKSNFNNLFKVVKIEGDYLKLLSLVSGVTLQLHKSQVEKIGSFADLADYPEVKLNAYDCRSKKTYIDVELTSIFLTSQIYEVRRKNGDIVEATHLLVK